MAFLILYFTPIRKLTSEQSSFLLMYGNHSNDAIGNLLTKRARLLALSGEAKIRVGSLQIEHLIYILVSPAGTSIILAVDSQHQTKPNNWNDITAEKTRFELHTKLWIEWSCVQIKRVLQIPTLHCAAVWGMMMRQTWCLVIAPFNYLLVLCFRKSKAIHLFELKSSANVELYLEYEAFVSSAPAPCFVFHAQSSSRPEFTKFARRSSEAAGWEGIAAGVCVLALCGWLLDSGKFMHRPELLFISPLSSKSLDLSHLKNTVIISCTHSTHSIIQCITADVFVPEPLP